MERAAKRGRALPSAGAVAVPVPPARNTTGANRRDLLTIRGKGLGRGIRAGIGGLSEGQAVRARLGTVECGRPGSCGRQVKRDRRIGKEDWVIAKRQERRRWPSSRSWGRSAPAGKLIT